MQLEIKIGLCSQTWSAYIKYIKLKSDNIHLMNVICLANSASDMHDSNTVNSQYIMNNYDNAPSNKFV